MATKAKPLPTYRGACGRLTVLQRLNDHEFGVELRIMREGVNRNDWDFQNLEKHYLSFTGAPILCAYVGEKIGDGHNMRRVRDPKTGAESYSFTDGTAERIVGTLSDDPKDLSLEQRDGHTWILAKGRLFAFYAPELVGKIVQTGSMDVSAETEVRASRQNGKIEVITDWIGLGVTILGDDVAPAIPGARIAALAAMQEEFKRLKLRAAAYRENSKTQNHTENNKRTNKGVSVNMNKQAIARLAGKFEGYEIAGLSEDQMHAVLVNSAGETFTYTFNAADGGEVMLSRIRPTAPLVTFALEDGGEIGVDLADILAPVARAARQMAAQAQEAEASLEKANSTIETMRQAEHSRRLEEIRNSLEAEGQRIMQTEPEVGDQLKDAQARLLADAEAYAEMEENGAFCGHARACAALRSIAMELHLAAAEEARNSAVPAFAWDIPRGDEMAEAGGIADTLAYISK